MTTLKDMCRERLLEQAAERTDEGVALVASYLKHVLFAGHFVPVADIAFLAHAYVGNRDKFSATIYADETKTAAVSARLGYFVDEYQRVTAGNPEPEGTIAQMWVASRCSGREFDCVIDAMLAETGWKLEDLDETPEPPAVAETPAMPALLDAAERLCIDLGPTNDQTTPLWSLLARFRCTCGEFPVEGSVHGYWAVRCCGKEWDCWEDFIAWRGKQ